MQDGHCRRSGSNFSWQKLRTCHSMFLVQPTCTMYIRVWFFSVDRTGHVLNEEIENSWHVIGPRQCFISLGMTVGLQTSFPSLSTLPMARHHEFSSLCTRQLGNFTAFYICPLQALSMIEWLIEWCFTLLSTVFQSYHGDSSHCSCLSWVSPLLGWALKCLAQGHSHEKSQRIQCGSNPVPLDYKSNTLPLSHVGPFKRFQYDYVPY